jgi:hypothetical protein
VDENYLFLYPEAVYQFIATAARAAGQTFPVESKTLLKRLEEAGAIETRKESGGDTRRALKVRFGKTTLRVIKLYRTAFEKLGEGESVPSNPSVPPVPSKSRDAPQLSNTQEGNPSDSHTSLYKDLSSFTGNTGNREQNRAHDEPEAVIDLTGEG